MSNLVKTVLLSERQLLYAIRPFAKCLNLFVWFSKSDLYYFTIILNSLDMLQQILVKNKSIESIKQHNINRVNLEY